MIVAVAWALFAMVAFSLVAASPPARAMPQPIRTEPPVEVGPWRLDRRAVVLGAGALALVVVAGPVVAAGIAMLVALARWWGSRRRIAADLADREAAVPELVELMAIALRSGTSPAAAVERVASTAADLRADPVLATAERLRAGLAATDAWSALHDLPGPAGPAMAELLESADRTGAPVADAMADLADSARAERRRRLETKLQRLPVLLLGPLVFCVLPSFLLLVCVPIVVSGLSDLL